MNETVYRDGIEAERCVTCKQMLRLKGGEPTVPIRVKDVEEIACLLEEYVDCPEVWADTIHRLEQAAGRTVAQMNAEQREINTAQREKAQDER